MKGYRRAPWHDYTSRCIYMLTLRKAADAPTFGNLAGNTNIPVGCKGSSYISYSPVGLAIRQAIQQLTTDNPEILIYQYAIMPDHLHLLLLVRNAGSESLGKIIARFKVNANKYSGIIPVFDRDFNDQILKPSRSLDVLFRYIRENPHRLAVRREHPEYFRRVNNLQICGNNYAAYGNMFLLSCPFKDFVVVHRRDSEAELASKRERWLYTAANGGVLVSPFISPAEKAIRTEAEALGAKIILISNTEMGERDKPSGHDFELCESGRLLIISVPSAELSRDHCLAMNSLAESIAGE